MKKVFIKSATIIAYAVFFICFSRCQLKSKQIESCKSNYKDATKCLNDYYQDHNQANLQRALPLVEGSMECAETRKSAVSLKVSLLVLLKKYKSGISFTDSLVDNDFAATYQKDMYHKYFLALDDESKADTVARDRLLNEIVDKIQNYSQHENIPNGKVDERVYYDLFLVKTKLFGIQHVQVEIDSLKEKYPAEQDFFEAMKGTLQELQTHAN